MRRALAAMTGAALMTGLLVSVPAQGAASEVDITRVDVTAHDGTSLGGWVGLPAGTPTDGSRKLPVVLISTPYIAEAWFGTDREPDDQRLDPAAPGYWTDWDTDGTNGSGARDAKASSLGFPVIKLIRSGFAVVVFSVRGTGSSAGCFEFGGRNEQLDQAGLVEWAGRQPWSTGKVVMGGLSYQAFTAMQAAVQAPEPLVAIVTAGDLTDLATWVYTPQGAMRTGEGPFIAAFGSNFALSPGPFGDKTDEPVHACPDVIAQFATRPGVELASSVRDKAFWEERRLTGRLPRVRAAVLSATGFWDTEGHQLQDALMWELLKHAPKRFVRGWWHHTWPSKEYDADFADDIPMAVLDPSWEDATWSAIAQRWVRYWAKGEGTPGRIGVTDVVQEAGRSWTTRKGWSEQPEEVLYLRDELLATRPGGTSQAFLDAPDVRAQYFGTVGLGLPQPRFQPALCPDPDPMVAATHAVYRTPTLTEPVTLGGNPFAYLRLSSDQPTGVVNAHLFDVGPDFSCDPVTGLPSGERWLSTGTADLRHHASFYDPVDFPVGTPQQVRVDLSDTFAHIPAGHQLVLVLGYGEPLGAEVGEPAVPGAITVHADGGLEASQLVLPAFDGTLGAKRPHLHYPERPLMR